MKNEFHPCTKDYCFVRRILLSEPVAFWPLELYAEKGPGNTWLWTFYVKWTPQRGTHKNKAQVCEKHHKQLLKMFQEEAALDVRHQEATDQWMIRNGSRL